MKADKGSIPQKSQIGLKPTLISQNHFLACACIPEEDIEVSLPNSSFSKITAIISRMEWLNESVFGLWLRPTASYSYKAGQFLRLYKDGAQDTFRCYSLVSVPVVDAEIFLNIRRVPGGQLSNWICEDLSIGDQIAISESIGNSFYLGDKPNQNMLLIATGSGLGALYGVARDALIQSHSGHIHLYHSVSDNRDFYLESDLLALAERYPNFSYYPCVSRGEVSGIQASGRALDIAMAKHDELGGWRVYLCGNSHMVHAGKRKAYLNGASLQDIYGDPFGS